MGGFYSKVLKKTATFSIGFWGSNCLFLVSKRSNWEVSFNAKLPGLTKGFDPYAYLGLVRMPGLGGPGKAQEA